MCYVSKMKVSYFYLLWLLIFIPACAMSPDTPNAPNDGHDSHRASKSDEHAGHKAMMKNMLTKENDTSPKYQKKSKTYRLEGLSLVRMDNQEIELVNELPSNEPIILNFIFTTCTTICPVLSATFSQFQDKLGKSADRVRMISISIDPEYDTPSALRAYAKKFAAGPQWLFYTGTHIQSVNAQRAFEAYRGGKMNHVPITFMRAPGSNEWLRIEGFTNSSELLSEYQRLLDS